MISQLIRWVRTAIPWRWRFAINRRLLDAPSMGKIYLSVRPAYASQIITDETTLLIEGYPRSANTYAKYAAHFSMGLNLDLAGHAHSAALVHMAVARGTPTIVLVRNPDDAAASLCQFMDGVPLADCFNAYTRFYSNVLPIAEYVQVSSFESIVEDFGAEIKRLNARFGTDFPIYRKSTQGEVEIQRLVEADGRRRHGGDLPERSAARPSASRRSAKDLISSSDEDLEKPRAEAWEVYDRFREYFG